MDRQFVLNLEMKNETVSNQQFYRITLAKRSLDYKRFKIRQGVQTSHHVFMTVTFDSKQRKNDCGHNNVLHDEAKERAGLFPSYSKP